MPIHELHKILTEQSSRLENSFQGDPIIPLIEIIRTLDYQDFMLSNSVNDINAQQRLSRLQYGWGHIFQLFYKQYTLRENIISYKSTTEMENWANSGTFHAGTIETCRQLLNYVRANLMSISMMNEDKFIFNNLYKVEFEQYEGLSLAYSHYRKSKHLENQSKLIAEALPKVRQELENHVAECRSIGISYNIPKKIDKFYSDFGYIHAVSTITLDDFDENDSYGNLKYKDFINFIYYLRKSAIKHRDCCMALAVKTNHTIYLRNILTKTDTFERITNEYSQICNRPINEIKEIIDCFTIDWNNIDFHLGYPKPEPAPFFKLGNNNFIFSVYGSMKNPVYFLNRELKRRYPKDFFNAVNNREVRFRNELYALFPQENIIKVNDNIIIKGTKGKVLTDLDAVIFNRETKTLALFQLKWQDTFSTNFKERYSRISNLIPKSTEWIEKVDNWLNENTTAIILEKLKIHNEVQITNCRLFIVSRNHMHFTNTTLDNRATWASWHQIIESIDSTETTFSNDPIVDFDIKINRLSPINRAKEDVSTFQILEQSFKLANYEVVIEPN